MKLVKLSMIILAGCGFLCHSANAARRFNRRSDLNALPPVSSFGYTVPLEGSETCSDTGICNTNLTAPSAGKILKYFTMARGISTYSCENSEPTDAPTILFQDATLWDCLPLLPYVPSEALFHTLIPQLYEYNYTALKNSSLSCIGSLTSFRADGIIDIFNMGIITAHVQETVNAPDDPTKNIQWARSLSSDLSWEIYRVITVGGVPAPTCEDNVDSDIEYDYAAEYWFYHA